MKVKNGLMIHKTPGGTVAVATGEAARAFNGMLRLSDTAEVIVRAMMTETTVDAVATALTEKYDIDMDTARADVMRMVEQLTQAGLMA